MKKSKYRRFKIKSQESIFWFWVCIYDDVKKLREDTNDGVPFHKSKYEKKDFELFGVFEPYTRIFFEKGKPDRLHENIGIVRLWKKDCSSETTAHELLHAALWNYRVMHKTVSLGKDSSDKEEQLCYIHGQLFLDFTRKMYKLGFWK